MNRSLLSAVLVLLVALIVGLFFWLRAPVQHEPAIAAAAAAPAPTESARGAVDLATSPQASEPDRAVARAPASEPAQAADTQPAAAPPPKYDKDARGTVHLIVQDKLGAAVPNAEVRLTGLRSKREPGSHWGLDETSVGKSAADGTVQISFPIWLDVDLDVGFLTLRVQHPEFVTLELDMFDIDPEPRVVVLERGAFLIVSGYIGSPDQVVRDVTPRLTDEVEVPRESWLPIKDGRKSNATIPTGTHALYLTHLAPDGRRFHSEVVFFELAPQEQKELHLELHPPIELEGVLDRDVPRPIRGGRVVLNLVIGTRDSETKTLRPFTAEVREDGTFTVDGLPPGDGEIVGSCEGWVSRRVPATDARKEDEGSASAMVLQSVDPSRAQATFELLMEPAATMAALIRDPDGKPVAGAKLSLWPNVTWRIGYSQLFPSDQSFDAESDENGYAVVANLPPGSCWYGVEHERFELKQDSSGFRGGEVELASGKSVDVSVELVTRGAK